MAADFTMRQLLEAGVHFGHQTQRWNPRMGQFIYGERNGIHIMDLTQTVKMLDADLKAIQEDRKSTRLNSSNVKSYRMPSSD